MFLQYIIIFQNTIQVTPYHIYSNANCKYTKDGLHLKYMGLYFVHIKDLNLSPVQYFQCVPDNLDQPNNFKNLIFCILWIGMLNFLCSVTCVTYF
jgi:hypothetical protein